MSDGSKLEESADALAHALTFRDRIEQDPFYFSGISKAFEVCFEYAWKSLKSRAENSGLEVYSPRDAIKAAGQLNLIDDVELWLGFLKDRNLAVHDYIGVDDSEYLETIVNFLREVRKIQEKATPNREKTA